MIPFSVSRIYRLLKSKELLFLPEIFLVTSFGVLLLLAKPAFFGKIRGTLEPKEIPEQYLLLKDFLEDQKSFFRTFWIPQKHRFGYYSNNHPAISSESFMTDSLCLDPFCSLKTEMPEKWGKNCSVNDRCYVKELSYLLNPRALNIFSQLAIKYIIVPLDSEGEIFIAEHKYNPQQRQEVEEFLDTIPWLKKIAVIDKIAIYELPESKDLFFINQLKSSRVNELKSWKMINPTKYLVSLKINQPPVKVIFSETYDPLWQADLEGVKINSQPLGYLNSFQIERGGELNLTIEYQIQKYINYGLIISIFGLSLSGLFLFSSR